jgi:hypothetical protein
LSLASLHAPVFFRRVPPRRRLFSLALCLLAGLGVARAEPPPLPFTLDDPDGRWRLTSTERTLSGGFRLVGSVSPKTGPAQMLVFTAPTADAGAETIADFGERLRAMIVKLPAVNLRSEPTQRLGYYGQLLRFDCVREGVTFGCELFAFAAANERWGLFEVASAEGSAANPSVFPILQKAAPVPAGATALAPFRVQDNPLTSYPVSLRVQRNHTTDRVEKIIVTEVPPDSNTERAGVKVGDEILRINGRPVVEFGGGVGRRSELGRILVDRPPGSTVELDLVTPGDPAPRHVKLTAGQPMPEFFRR